MKPDNLKFVQGIMKRYFLKWVIKLKGIFSLSPKRIDVDAIVQENLSLMKEMRMHRIKFYKFYNKAQAYLN